MSLQYDEGTCVWGTDVESADETVDACGGDDCATVFVPVVGEGFVGGEGAGEASSATDGWGWLLLLLRGGVYGDR